MPDGVTSIGKYAFGGCSRLTSIAIPDKVITLSSNAFQFCTELTSIDVGEDNTEYSSIDGALYDKNASTLLKCPEGKISIAILGNMANIGDIAFYLCSRLTSINVDENNAKYLSIDGALYDKNASTLIKCPEDIPSITIPNSVTSIGDESLSRLNLTSITIPNSVINIGDRALSSSNFTSITIPNSVTSLGNGAFYDCSRMREIHIGYKSVSGMNPSVFENVDTSVCVLYVPRGCKNAYSIADGWRSFKNIVEE